MERTSTVEGCPGGPTAEAWPLTAKIWVEIMVDLLQSSGNQKVGAENYLSEAMHQIPWNWSSGYCKFPHGFLELNKRPLQEQPLHC